MSDIKVVNELYDAAADQKVLIAMGTIERIVIKRINADGSPKVNQVKSGPKAGSTISSTHRSSILLKTGEDSQWVSFGTHEVKNLKYENQYQIKEGNDYVELKPGMVIRLPVELRTWKGADGKDASGYQGRRNKITIKDKSGARDDVPQNAPNQSSGAPAASGGKTVKVYGDIVSVSGAEVLVKTEAGEVTVKLTEDQLGKIQEGGRLAGQRAEDGTVTQFKAYGPKGSGNSSSGSRGKSKDDLPIRLGNALTVTKALFPNDSVILQGVVIKQVLAAMDSVKNKLREEFKDMDDYAFGARLGQAGILSGHEGIEDPSHFAAKVEEVFRFVCDLEKQIRAGDSDPAPTQQEPDLKPNPQDSDDVATNGHIDYSQDNMDFDDDIPF